MIPVDGGFRVFRSLGKSREGIDLMSRFVLSGFSDEIAPGIDEQIAGVRELGLSHLVLRFVDGENIVDLSLEKAKEIKKKLDDNNIRVSSLGSPIGKVDVDSPLADEMKRLLHIIELAEIFETEFVRIFSFYLPPESNPQDYADKVIERLGAMAVVAQKHGITLIHENEKDIFGDTEERCNQILTAFIWSQSSIRSCHLFSAMSILWQPITTKKHRIHAYKGCFASDHSIVPAGKGDGRISEILSDLASNGKDSELFLSLEPHLGTFMGLNTLEKDTVVSDEQESSLELYKSALDSLLGVLQQL